jgi:hypothetical protein
LILTLFTTIILEGLIVLGYCTWRKKPVRSLLITSIFINLLTQSLLWVVLNLFFQQYLITLLISEILIWLVESALLYLFPANQLRFVEALFLSLGMNLTSFALGWFLPN